MPLGMIETWRKVPDRKFVAPPDLPHQGEMIGFNIP
jgi:hypothetical protein